MSKKLDRYYLLKYGIRLLDYNNLLKKQKGVCGICGNKCRVRLAVDHCHKTGKVRGLLCGRCNMAIGKLGDTSHDLKAAYEYLLKGECEDVLDEQVEVESDRLFYLCTADYVEEVVEEGKRIRRKYVKTILSEHKTKLEAETQKKYVQRERRCRLSTLVVMQQGYLLGY